MQRRFVRSALMERLFVAAMMIGKLMVAGAQPPPEAVVVQEDLLARWMRAPVRGVSTPTAVRTIRSGGVERQAGFLHPTDQPARIEFSLDLSKALPNERWVLLAWAGVDDNARRDDPENPHDGVTATLLVEEQAVSTVECLSPGWQALSLDLTPYRGKRIRVQFAIAHRKNANYDWAYIAEPMVVRLREPLAHRVSDRLPPEGVLEVSGRAGEAVTIEAQGFTPISATIPEGGRAWIRYGFSGAREARLNPPQRSALLYPFFPRLRLESVHTRKALLTPNERVEVVATLRNEGQGTWTNEPLQLTVSALQQGRVVSLPRPAFELLAPGASQQVVFQVQVGLRPRFRVVLRSRSGTSTTTLAPAVASLPPRIPDTGGLARQIGGHWVLQNAHLRLVLSPIGGGEYGARLYGNRENRWTLLATTPRLAEGILTPTTTPTPPFGLRVARVVPNARSLSLTLQGLFGSVGRTQVVYRLVGNRLECQARLTPTRPASLYLFRFPDWRIGDGTFGSTKDEALFPGLEYLLDEEPSSDTRFASPPYHLRVSPHPYKITVPLMAVRWRNWLVSLHWDARAQTAKAGHLPNALFASPNFLESAQNHRFALWLPSIPDWAEENSLQARKPLNLRSGESVSLSATLVVLNNAIDISQAIETHLQAFGMAPMPKPQSSDAEMMSLTLQGLLTCYDPAKKSWRHTNTGPTFYDPLVANALWVLAHRLEANDPNRRSALTQVREAVGAIPIKQLGWENAFYLGGLPTLLNEWRESMRALAQAQRADGTWAWNPESPRHAVFGKAGDTSSGWTGNRASQIGRYALVTLDTEAQACLLRALEALSRMRRPEGAQTWELPLHVPDVLAVPYILNAYLDAYALTGEARYLQEAQRWALRGLPFVYLWQAPDRPLMVGASIPVYGVTWFNSQPWFGVAVQWNGLVYAQALYRLAQTERNTPYDWRRFADALTLSAVQQQEWTRARYPDHAGMYPDAFSIVKGSEEYHWDLNPRLLAPCIAQRQGFALEPITQIVRYENLTVACTAPGLRSVRFEENTLTVEIEPPAQGLPAIYLFVAGWGSGEPKVRVDGVSQPRVPDMDRLVTQVQRPRSGWAVHPLGLIVRIGNPAGRVQVQIQR